MSIDKKVIYYTNELEDEFSEAQIEPKVIDGSYSYEGGFWRQVGRVFVYNIVAKPFGYAFLKVKYGHKIINRKLLKEVGKQGFFLYGNHTNQFGDPFVPSMVCFPKGVYVVVHPNNVSMPVLGKFTPCLGALPLPGNMEAARNFNKAISHKIEQGKCVMIYPEAHIWPYYTKIRPFKDASFGYPITCGAKVFCFTNTYQKRKFRRTPRIVTYIDGPFEADSSLPVKRQKEMLRNQVYDAMVKASANNNVEMIKYIKKEPEDLQ